MSEKRKPSHIWLLRKQGKNNTKIEFFNASLFGYKNPARQKSNKYRLRVNGKWFDNQDGYKGRTYFTKWEFRDLLFKSLGNF